MTNKVLYDTDIGSDVDDAAALAYLLTEPECEVVGITTVSGQALQRAQLASALCMAADQNIPIFPGADDPLWGPQLQGQAPQAQALPQWSHQTSFETGAAIEFLRQTIRAHPGEITLLATGPLTNIALLFAIDPEVPRLLQQFVMMGGVYTPAAQFVTPAEWNMRCDPLAAAMVMHAELFRHRALGLEMTMQVRLPQPEVRARFTHPILLPVRDFAEIWFRENGDLIFHDPLAAVSICHPDVCTYSQGWITVTVNGLGQSGATHWQSDAHGVHSIAQTVAQESFFAYYFGAFGIT
jgi:purine nucleosidase